jgi:lysophospholipase L1-like esterase
MATFADTCRQMRARSLSVFGDSITAGTAASVEHLRWANRLAAAIGAGLRNKAISGTVMQASPDAGGLPRADNGVSRFPDALLGPDCSDAIAILYGYNDARYTGAPATFGLYGFVRDYRTVIGGLLSAGYAPRTLCLGSPPAIPDAGFAVGSAGFTGQTRDVFETFVAAVGELARAYGTFYAPVYEHMRQRGEDALTAPDHTHPNDEGHAVIAAAFGDATLPVLALGAGQK